MSASSWGASAMPVIMTGAASTSARTMACTAVLAARSLSFSPTRRATPTAAGVAPILALMALAGLGFGVFQPANNRLLLLSAPKARSGAAGGVQATTRLVGQTFGATMMTALFQLAPGDVAPRLGLVAAAGFALTAAIIGAVNARHIE